MAKNADAPCNNAHIDWHLSRTMRLNWTVDCKWADSDHKEEKKLEFRVGVETFKLKLFFSPHQQEPKFRSQG